MTWLKPEVLVPVLSFIDTFCTLFCTLFSETRQGTLTKIKPDFPPPVLSSIPDTPTTCNNLMHAFINPDLIHPVLVVIFTCFCMHLHGIWHVSCKSGLHTSGFWSLYIHPDFTNVSTFKNKHSPSIINLLDKNIVFHFHFISNIKT